MPCLFGSAGRSATMNGQWLGRYSGSNVGTLVIELDDMGTHYEGRAFAYDDNTDLPGTFALLKTATKENGLHLRLPLFPIDPRTDDPTTWNQIASLFPNVVFPVFADVDLDFAGDTLKVSWKTNIETSGSATITRSRADAPTDYQPLSDVTHWEQFKNYVSRLEHRRYIFRGQTKPLRLRTSFHRTGRADLARFLEEDIKTLHRHLSLRTSHVFNLMIPDENGAFFNLVQHHGYPTPLLDWTFSPFVAAFFAYHRLKNSEALLASADKKVRIFVFDQKAWRAKFRQIPKLTPARPHFSILEFIAIDNQRLIPQQSVSSVTNVDDIETYIRSLQTPDEQYLQIADLPLNERPAVMQELSVMGITAGSLFPGLDGTCEELRERFFQNR
jgi:hypothetical protein